MDSSYQQHLLVKHQHEEMMRSAEHERLVQIAKEARPDFWSRLKIAGIALLPRKKVTVIKGETQRRVREPITEPGRI